MNIRQKLETPQKNEIIKPETDISLQDHDSIISMLKLLSNTGIDDTEGIISTISKIYERLKNFSLKIDNDSQPYLKILKTQIEPYLNDFAMLHPMVKVEAKNQIDHIVNVFGLTCIFESEKKERSKYLSS